jgi:hypothetical protein
VELNQQPAATGILTKEKHICFRLSFEWVWDIGHLLFFGGLWYAIGILGAGMTYCIVKSAIDTMKDSEENHH